MQLPQKVREAIEARAETVGFAALKRAASALSGAYREGRAPHGIEAAGGVAAYLVTRMPATYAATHAALRAAVAHLGQSEIASVLDIGAGSGAASLAAREYFPDARFTLIERDAALSGAAREWLPEAAVIARDLTRIDGFPAHDLAIASYSLGEVSGEAGRALALRLWQAARVALLIVEPGTPKGFAFLRGIRTELLAAGAHMLAPCPAATPCPMADPDWCHFAARVERSSIHRRIKDGALGYEDEKFSYIAVTREPVALPAARVVRHPQHRPGLIVLETCTPTGLETARVSKRNREGFRAARKAGWGDAVP